MQYLFTFAEGVFAFVSPCILPMLPIFLAYISADEKRSLSKRFFNTLFFVLGFTFAFVLMGATAFSLGRFMGRYKGFLIKLAGVLLVVFGFVYLDIINISLTLDHTPGVLSSVLNEIARFKANVLTINQKNET